MSQISMGQVRATYKARDSWWTVLLVDPIVAPLVRWAAGHRWITPNRLTGLAFLFGLAAAVAFLQATPAWLIAGALLYHIGFMIDCTDGKVARLQGTGSIFGGWLDFVLDRIRVLICVIALFAGQWLRTDDPVFLFVATGTIFLALFGYVNGAETDKAQAKLAAALRLPEPELALEPATPAVAAEPPTAGRADQALVEQALVAQAATGRTAGRLVRLRTALHRRRIRVNLVSGIEFEMAVLIVAPLVGAAAGPTGLLWVTAAAAALLISFELALVARFWLATRLATTRLAAVQSAAHAESTTGHPEPGGAPAQGHPQDHPQPRIPGQRQPARDAQDQRQPTSIR